MSDAQAQPYYALFSRLPGWEKKLDQANPYQFKICCPFHSEDSPSFHVNVDSGVWTCFGKCARSGGPKEVESYLGDTVDEPTKTKRTEPEVPLIDWSIIDVGHKNLLANAEAIDKLHAMGITQETIVKHSLGHQGERYMWPIMDPDGKIHNIRLYKPGSGDGDKVISFTQMVDGKKVSYGSRNTRLFPEIVARENAGLFLCEGEKDALVLNSLGFAAVSVTGGAGQWSPELCNPLLQNKYVIIVYDVDDKGKAGARKVALILRRIARRVKIANLPDGGLPKNGDVADFIALDREIAKAWFQLQLDNILAATDEDPEELDNLASTKLPKYHGHSVKVDAHVVGKETTPFTAERGYRLACPQSKGKICDSCPMNDNGGEMEFVVESASKELLYTIERTDQQIEVWLAEKSGIPRNCNLWDHESMDEHKSSVEKILLSTTVDQRSYDGPSEYVQQMAYVVDSPVVPNSVYTLSGRMTNHPKDQSNVLIVTKAETSRLSIDTFVTTPELHARLQFFQPREDTWQSIMDRVDHRMEDLADNVTHIYRRSNTHLIVDLVAHSLLSFECFGRIPDRCWLEGYVGGDTRQGKSEVAKRLHAHYRAGEIVVSENASLAGILGGAQKLGNGEWMVSWGKCPLNDRGWVTFDECQNISLQIMGALSGMRSSGVAEIDKIRVERVNSRTRILWLSNPRSDAITVDSLSQGIMLAKDVFGRPEDIARLDLMSVVRAADVDGSVVHEDHSGTTHNHTAELCHQLLMFAWSRKYNEINFTDEAALAARGVSERLGTRYNCDIKIVEPMEQRFKVARVAAAIAALTYSTEDGTMIEIRESHVMAAEQVFMRLFDDPAVAYNDYALSYSHRLAVRSRDEVWKWCGGQAEELLRTILNQSAIRMYDIQNYGDFTREEAQTNVSFLLQQRALFTNETLDYVKNSEFVAILRDALAQNHHAVAKDNMFLKKGKHQSNERSTTPVNY
jgi:hypothetical protein